VGWRLVADTVGIGDTVGVAVVVIDTVVDIVVAVVVVALAVQVVVLADQNVYDGVQEHWTYLVKS